MKTKKCSSWFLTENGATCSCHFAENKPEIINREELFAEFEILHAHLAKHEISNPLEFNKLRARLSDLAYAYSGSPIDHSDFLLHREHFQALKSLWANNDIFITKPDKGSGVVILNKKDYINKMEVILHDKEKFAKLGDVETHDKTAKLVPKMFVGTGQLKNVGYRNL